MSVTKTIVTGVIAGVVGGITSYELRKCLDDSSRPLQESAEQNTNIDDAISKVDASIKEMIKNVRDDLTKVVDDVTSSYKTCKCAIKEAGEDKESAEGESGTMSSDGSFYF